MNDPQQPTRREFVRRAAAGAVALVLPRAVFAQATQRAEPRSTFAPKLGVCTSLKNAAMLKQCGVDYVEVGVRSVLVPDKCDQEFAENLGAARACGLPVAAANGFLPGSLKCTGPEANHDAVLRFAETAFRRAKAVGIKVIVFGSSGSRTPPEGFSLEQTEEQFVALLRRMGPLAEPHGVMVALEPLNRKETPFINTVEHGARIVRAVKHANIRLLADIYHMLREEEPPEQIRAAGELLVHVHVAEKSKRTAPGVAGDDFRPYLRALRDIRYAGRISMECRWKEMDAELPTAEKTLRKQIAGLG